MRSQPISPRAEADATKRLAGQRARIERLEAALWDDGPSDHGLREYQQAWRELETLIAAQGEDHRHHFVIVIPVADSPRHLRACLDSLLTLCERYAYGGHDADRYRKVSVLLADDSELAPSIAAHQAIADHFTAQGLATEYFGVAQQLALLERLQPHDLEPIIGRHELPAFAHKGQGMMRNIAYLRLAEIASRQHGDPLLFFTIDADQSFRVRVATDAVQRDLYAVNYLAEIDRVFRETDARVLTGKVVGDPPVSPAVMAANFLDDVIGFVGGMAGAAAADIYRQPALDARGSGDAAYHDMADLFGFDAGRAFYRYHCDLPGAPTNRQCFADFAGHLNRFFHGEHPTRTTWYRYQAVAQSVQPARTVYTGNYVFSVQALDWFIPFAPLRLRMSGPTMGRLLKAGQGERFVSANVPMLHTRTLDSTGESEFRPGVVAQQQQVDLSDEFERQFFGDVMLFSMQRLAEAAYPQSCPDPVSLAGLLDQVRDEMRERYAERQQRVLQRLDQLRGALGEAGRWWHDDPACAEAMAHFSRFIDNLARNFGRDSAWVKQIASADNWTAWRQRQIDAIQGFDSAREAWRAALQTLRAMD